MNDAQRRYGALSWGKRFQIYLQTAYGPIPADPETAELVMACAERQLRWTTLPRIIGFIAPSMIVVGAMLFLADVEVEPMPLLLTPLIAITFSSVIWRGRFQRVVERARAVIERARPASTTNG